MENIRRSSTEELMIISSFVKQLEPNVFKDFPKLHAINLSCNRVNAFHEMMKAFANLGSSPLPTLILDGMVSGKFTTLMRIDFCTDVGKKVKKLEQLYFWG